MNHNEYYSPTLPDVSIRCIGGANLGRCYNSYIYRIDSRHKLTEEKIMFLRKAGFLGYGQEFKIVSPVGEYPLTHEVEQEHVFLDKSGDVEKIVPLKENEQWTTTFYIYFAEDRVDSSD